MLVIESMQPKGIVLSTITLLSMAKRALGAWILSAFDQVVLLFVPAFDESTAGLVYSFTASENPTTWIISQERSAVISQRTNI